MSLALIILIIIVIAYDYLNGMNDSGNIVASMVSSRSMSLSSALLLAAIFEFIGPFVVGTAVAKTIGSGLVDPSVINLKILYAAVLGAITWNIITQVLGYPSSSSHALLGGIIGAVAVSAGVNAIKYMGVLKILIVLLVSPLLGFLITCGIQSAFLIPFWVMILCSLALASGILTGGMRIMKTLGSKVFKVKPIHGFGIQFSSALVICSAALIGSPVSTTHVVSSSVIGAGSSVGLNKVRWGTVTDIILSWVLTVPFSALIAIVFYYGIMYINP